MALVSHQGPSRPGGWLRGGSARTRGRTRHPCGHGRKTGGVSYKGKYTPALRPSTLLMEMTTRPQKFLDKSTSSSSVPTASTRNSPGLRGQSLGHAVPRAVQPCREKAPTSHEAPTWMGLRKLTLWESRTPETPVAVAIRGNVRTGDSNGRLRALAPAGRRPA